MSRAALIAHLVPRLVHITARRRTEPRGGPLQRREESSQDLTRGLDAGRNLMPLCGTVRERDAVRFRPIPHENATDMLADEGPS